MTPRRARRALCVFLLLAAAVAYNALVRQVRPTPSSSVALEAAPPPALALERPPKMATSALAEPAPEAKETAAKRAQRLARFKPEPGPAAPPSPTEPALKPDAQSAETIRAIERDKGLGPKGRVSAEVLAHLTAPAGKLSRR